MNKRLQQLIDKGIIPNKGGVFIDSYNQSVNEDVAGTITTRIDASNMSYVTEPKIIEVRAIGRERTEEEKKRRHLYGDKGAKFSGGKQMCFLSEISGCLTTSPTKDNLVGEIYDVNCNKENKMNNDALTSVQKDGLTVDPLIIDDIYKDREARVYDDVSPTMRSGHDTMKVAEPLRIPQATKQGYIEVPQGAVFDMSYPESTTRRGRVQEGGQVSPTLMAGGEAPCYFEGVSVHPNSNALEFKGQKSIKQDAAPSLRTTDYKAPHCVWEKVDDELKQITTEARKEPIEVTINEHGSLRPHKLNKAKTGISEFQVENEEDTAKTLCLNSKVNGKQPSLEHRIYDSEGIATAMTTGFHPNIQEPTFRIRKLTPRECFRLMGVSESDIDKIQKSGVSQSQQYRMAGNSIVVDVLEHIFRKMFVDKGQESQQLSLF